MTAAFSLLFVLLLLGFILFLLPVLLLARAILRPPRMTDGKAIHRLHRLSPGDLGLRFENETFTVQDRRTNDRFRIAAWWIPHPGAAGRCVILIHGYADAKVGAIAWAPLLHSLGWNILAIDLRAHGESGGRYCTGGYFERDDVTQVIDELITARPGDARQVVLFGVSLGAAVAAAVASSRHDLAGVVLESPFTDYKSVVAAHLKLLGLPGGLLLRAALNWAEFISGSRFDRVRPLDAIPLISCPVLAILGGADELLSAAEFADLKAAIHQRQPTLGRLLIVTQAPHLLAMNVDLNRYTGELNDFLQSLPASRGAPALTDIREYR